MCHRYTRDDVWYAAEVEQLIRMVRQGGQAFPFATGCSPLSYSGNPGVNVDSHWETPLR